MERILTLLVIVAGLSHAFLPPPESFGDLERLCANQEAELEYERNQFYEMTKCLARVLNATEFRQQILSTGQNGQVDAVVDKVCKKLPEIVECTSHYVSSIGPCLDENEKREKELWKNLRQMNMEFACGVGRSHLIKFIVEGGIQCIATYRTSISQCVNDKFPDLLKQQSDTQIVKTLAIITQQEGKCSSLKEVEACVNTELLKCMDAASLSIIRQYFSSLDVLFACVNVTEEMSVSDSQPVQNLPENSTNILKSIAAMQDESLQLMIRINDGIERLARASEQRTQVHEADEKKILDILVRQAATVEKIANTIDESLTPRLKKNTSRGQHNSTSPKPESEDV